MPLKNGGYLNADAIAPLLGLLTPGGAHGYKTPSRSARSRIERHGTAQQHTAVRSIQLAHRPASPRDTGRPLNHGFSRSEDFRAIPRQRRINPPAVDRLLG